MWQTLDWLVTPIALVTFIIVFLVLGNAIRQKSRRLFRRLIGR
jgi:hypothetical protein